ncbi:ATP-binding cassette domain-containing protein [Psittacicella gerlachiana]|uniref:ABC transporter domain-containing protein n=1 Tax=Psittacicella gerlachiana TaxID=2028574 RepID=A0A3A1YHH5_9GAMM|nr:ATP-binding cassette domain-containing protein [Psittacicella gerlachiana]RIY35487.1 hypothetical protein CKF59_03575 [Psittacicella gerlachiana]
MVTTKKPAEVILTVNHLSKSYLDNKLFRKRHLVVDKVDFKIYRGEIFGITGHNSCGKSSLANMLVGLVEPDDGEIIFGEHLLNYRDVKFRREHIRLAHTDMVASFTLPLDVKEFLSLPLQLAEVPLQEHERIIMETLSFLEAPVDLNNKLLSRLNNQEQALVCLAHSLILQPEIIIVDDIFATCDLSFKGVLVNILLRLQERGQTVILITADLGIIKHLTDRVMILQDGVIEDLGKTYDILTHSQNEFTNRLVKSYFGRQLKSADWLFSFKEF